ncbi:MAG: SUMF1/EgtB/PvdO family nonheme iron enzyme [Planctomycetota bacterium]
MPGHIFLSHAGPETQLAREVKVALEAAGLTVWLDVDQLEHGRNWITEIESAMREASGFVVLVDRLDVRRWVTEEVHLALRKDVDVEEFGVLPLLGPNADPGSLRDSFLGNKHVVQYVDSWDTAAAEVASRIAGGDDGPEFLLAANHCPYFPLKTFQTEDALLFHGRAREVSDLVAAVDKCPLVTVVGVSGSGKSSLVRAGLVPALLRGRIYRGGNPITDWRTIVFRPGRAPFEALVGAVMDATDKATEERAAFKAMLRDMASGARPVADVLEEATAPGSHVLLVVDQLEELIRQAPRAEAERFVASLLDALEDGRGLSGDRTLRVVQTLRADHVDAIMGVGFGDLASRTFRRMEPLQLPAPAQLRQVIEGPLRMTPTRMLPEVTDRLLEDLGVDGADGQSADARADVSSANLAVLAFTLDRLWQHRRVDPDDPSRWLIDTEAYTAIGGLRGALDHYADQVFHDLGPEREDSVRRIFVRLTHYDDRGSHTRCTLGREDLVRGIDGGNELLEELRDKRLVADVPLEGDGVGYEVPHEALLRSWRRLGEWLAMDGADERLHQRLRDERAEWIDKRDEGFLLPRGRLVEAEAWAERRPEDLASVEDFLVESRRRLDDQDERDRAMARKVRGLEDLHAARGLLERAQELPAPLPGAASEHEAWLEEARRVVGRGDLHRDSLAELRALEERQPGLESQYEELLGLLETLAEGPLSASIEGEARSVPRRIAFARSIEERSVTGGLARERWGRVLDDFAAPDLFPEPYRGPLNASLAGLEPMAGLLPWRRDPSSGLWEFTHLWSGIEPEVEGGEPFRLTEATGLVLVLIPGGTFWMGAQADDPEAPGYDPDADRDEKPVRHIQVPPFLMAKTTVTQAQWHRTMGSQPSQYNAGTPGVDVTSPVESLPHIDCLVWCRLAGLDLPSEARWEYAARAGTTTPWWTGEERESLRGRVNLADQSARRAGADWPAIDDWPDLDDGFPVHSPADHFEPNRFGLYQVHGNVFEWCRDTQIGYSSAARNDPEACLEDGPLRVLRGGSFASAARGARSACRGGGAPATRVPSFGFRPAQVIP